MDKLKSVLHRNKDKTTDESSTAGTTSRPGQGSHFPGNAPDFSAGSATSGAQDIDTAPGSGNRPAPGFGNEGNVNPYTSTDIDPRVDGLPAGTVRPSRNTNTGATSATGGVSSGQPLTDRTRDTTATSGVSTGPPLTDRHRETDAPATSNLTSTADRTARSDDYDTYDDRTTRSGAFDSYDNPNTSMSGTSNPALTAATAASTRNEPTSHYRTEPNISGGADPVDPTQTSSTTGLMNRVMGAVGLGSTTGAGTSEVERDYNRGSAVADTPNQPTTVTGTDSYTAPTESGPPAGYRRESIPTTAYPSGSLDGTRASAGPTGRAPDPLSSGQQHYARDAAAGVGSGVGVQEYERTRAPTSNLSGQQSSTTSGMPTSSTEQRSYKPSSHNPTFYDAATAPSTAEADRTSTQALLAVGTDESSGGNARQATSSTGMTGAGTIGAGSTGQHQHHTSGHGGLFHHTNTAGDRDQERDQDSTSRAQTADIGGSTTGTTGQSSHLGRDAAEGGGLIVAGAAGAGAYESGRQEELQGGHVDQFAGEPYSSRGPQEAAVAGTGSGLGTNDRKPSTAQWADNPYSSREPGVRSQRRISVGGVDPNAATGSASVDQWADKPYSSREPGVSTPKRVSVAGQGGLTPSTANEGRSGSIDQFADRPYSSRELGVASPKRVSVAGQGGLGATTAGEGRSGSVDQWADRPYSSREPGVQSSKRVSVSGQGGILPATAAGTGAGTGAGTAFSERPGTSADQFADSPYSRRADPGHTAGTSGTPLRTAPQGHHHPGLYNSGRDAAAGTGGASVGGAYGAQDFSSQRAQPTSTGQSHYGRDAAIAGGAVGAGAGAAEFGKYEAERGQPTGQSTTGTTEDQVDPLGARHPGTGQLGGVAAADSTTPGYSRQGDVEAPGQFDYGAQRGNQDLREDQTGAPGMLPGESTTAAAEGVGVGTIDPVIARDVGKGNLGHEEAFSALGEGRGAGGSVTGAPASERVAQTGAGGRSDLDRDTAIGAGAGAAGGAAIAEHERGNQGHDHAGAKKPGLLSRIFKSRKNKTTGEDEEYDATDEEETSHHHGTGAGTAAVGGSTLAGAAIAEHPSTVRSTAPMTSGIPPPQETAAIGQPTGSGTTGYTSTGGYSNAPIDLSTAGERSTMGHPSTTGAQQEYTEGSAAHPTTTSNTTNTNISEGHYNKPGMLAGGHAYEEVSHGAVKPSYNPFHRTPAVNVPEPHAPGTGL